MTLFVIVLFSFGTAYAAELQISPQDTFVLPLSLREIEEDAFSGTAAETVILPKGFLKIDQNAFEGAWRLTDVYIPDTTECIADSAFSATSNLTVHGMDGSYAKDWAYRHEIPFVVDNVWYVIPESGRLHTVRTYPTSRHIATVVLIILFELFGLSYYEVRSRRPQDRPELYPINYRFP